jgi:hypothetical protein
MKTVKSNRDNIGNKLSDWNIKRKTQPYINLTSIDQIMLEVRCIDRLKDEVDHANAIILKNFQIKLVMDEDDQSIGFVS